MKLRKKWAALCLAAVLILTSVAGCGQKPSESGTSGTEGSETSISSETSVSSEAEAEDLDGGATNKEGLPIAKEPITITAGIKFDSMRPDKDTTNVWKYVEEKTNIKVEVEMYKDVEKANLMFASREYPDLIMSTGAASTVLTTAAQSGDLVELEPLLEEYAPTWNDFFKNNEVSYNSELLDGKLYSLPYVDFADFDRDLRDQWLFIKPWLDELNLEVPTTTEEFKEALLAVKENAGKGSIPENVVPFYFFFDNYVGGQFDVYASFGVPVTSQDYLVVEDGVVKDQSTNPDIKEPLKYLRDLYALELIPPEVFTDDWTTYISKTSSNPPIIASYGSYASRQPDMTVPMGPLDAENGKESYIRSQAYVSGVKNAAMISSTNPYPIATLRMLEWIASDPEAMITVNRGTQGVAWDYNEDGKAYELFWEESPDLMTENSKDLGMHNGFIGLRDQNFYENVWYDKNLEDETSRAWAYENVYKDKVMPNEWVYIEGPLSADDTAMAKQYSTDLANVRKTAFADFITGKVDIDSGWDAYVQNMKNAGLDQFVELKQKAYDVVAK